MVNCRNQYTDHDNTVDIFIAISVVAKKKLARNIEKQQSEENE